MARKVLYSHQYGFNSMKLCKLIESQCFGCDEKTWEESTKQRSKYSTVQVLSVRVLLQTFFSLSQLKSIKAFKLVVYLLMDHDIPEVAEVVEDDAEAWPVLGRLAGGVGLSSSLSERTMISSSAFFLLLLTSGGAGAGPEVVKIPYYE